MLFNITPIQMEWFYDLEGDKTKLNWYLLEISMEYYSRIVESPELASYREQNDEKQIALYCAYYARRLKKSLLDYLRGRRKTVRFYQDYVSDYYPQYDDRLTGSISRMARASFDHMWPMCRACPQQCLWEYEDRSPLFDEYQD
jgi:hypothetical protein